MILHSVSKESLHGLNILCFEVHKLKLPTKISHCLSSFLKIKYDQSHYQNLVEKKKVLSKFCLELRK